MKRKPFELIIGVSPSRLFASKTAAIAAYNRAKGKYSGLAKWAPITLRDRTTGKILKRNYKKK